MGYWQAAAFPHAPQDPATEFAAGPVTLAFASLCRPDESDSGKEAAAPIPLLPFRTRRMGVLQKHGKIQGFAIRCQKRRHSPPFLLNPVELCRTVCRLWCYKAPKRRRDRRLSSVRSRAEKAEAIGKGRIRYDYRYRHCTSSICLLAAGGGGEVLAVLSHPNDASLPPPNQTAQDPERIWQIVEGLAGQLRGQLSAADCP